MIVKITLQKSNKTINEIARFMEPNLESIFSREVISFSVDTQGEWLTEQRKLAFENKMNEENADKNIIYKVESIAVIL